jgi:tetratricopeptide (TPR) repeat protein
MELKMTTMRTLSIALAVFGLAANVATASQFRLQTSDAEVYGSRAIERGEYAKAAEKLDLALELAGDAHMMRAPVLNNLCVAYTMQSDFEQAAEYCNEYVENGRELSLAFNNRGVVAAARGDYAMAVMNFEAALEENPADVIARDNLSLAQQRLAATEVETETLANSADEAQPKG